jgi:hypothetical protein
MYWGGVERIRRNWYVQPYAYPWDFFVNAGRWRYAACKTQAYFNEDLPLGVPFVFFPLHLEPEATTQLYANYYENQLEVITALAKSLPVSWVLAVKEHPNMKSGRSWSFYRRLSRLPNVVLIAPETPSWRLVQECRLVATLSGTSGLEAGIIGKPALVFGDPVWGYAPTALKVKSLHELHSWPCRRMMNGSRRLSLVGLGLIPRAFTTTTPGCPRWTSPLMLSASAAPWCACSRTCKTAGTPEPLSLPHRIPLITGDRLPNEKYGQFVCNIFPL